MSTVYFFREHKDRNYTVINNTCLKDVSLSWKAKGVFAYILSLPEDWKIYMSELENHATDGRESLKSAINELKEHGYIQVSHVKNKNGTFAGNMYKIVENPPISADLPFAENPSTVKPFAENPAAENPQLLNTNVQSTNNTKYLETQSTDIKSTSDEVSDKPTVANTSKPKKKNSKAELFDRIAEYSNNETLKSLLGKYLQYKLSHCRGFTLDQWNLQLETLSKQCPRDSDKIEQVTKAYASGWQALVYKGNCQINNKPFMQNDVYDGEGF